MLDNVTYAIAGDDVPISRAYQPPTNKHVSQIARKRYQTTLRADWYQLRDYDKLHATRHATGAKVSTDLRDRDDDDGDLDRQERRVRARLNPAPAKSDDESECVDDVIDRHAQACNQDNAFISDGEAEELDEEGEQDQEEDSAEDSDKDSEEDGSEDEGTEDDDSHDEDEHDGGSLSGDSSWS